MWKDIIGWEEYYEISSDGEVRNKLTGKLLIGDKNNCGYYRVCLYNKNHTPPKQRFFRHRLVAQHFIENPNSLPQVNHKNGDKSDNKMNNLEWVTQKENEIHSRKIINTKEYKPFKVKYNDGTIHIYDVKSDLSQEINVTSSCVKNWLHGDTKGYINYGIREIFYI